MFLKLHISYSNHFLSIKSGETKLPNIDINVNINKYKNTNGSKQLGPFRRIY